MKFKERSIFVISLTTYSQSQSPLIAQECSTEIILQCYKPFSHPPERTQHISVSQSLSAKQSCQLRCLVWWIFNSNALCSRLSRMIHTQCVQGGAEQKSHRSEKAIYSARNQITLHFFFPKKKVVHGLFTCGFLKYFKLFLNSLFTLKIY